LQNIGLKRIFIATFGGSWNNNTNWITEESVCTWYGVSCDSSEFIKVTDLNMKGNNVKVDNATLFNIELLALEHLEFLDLSNNEGLESLEDVFFEKICDNMENVEVVPPIQIQNCTCCVTIAPTLSPSYNPTAALSSSPTIQSSTTEPSLSSILVVPSAVPSTKASLDPSTGPSKSSQPTISISTYPTKLSSSLPSYPLSKTIYPTSTPSIKPSMSNSSSDDASSDGAPSDAF